MAIDMLKFERASGGAQVVGIDEAGRGPLYGPVVAAAVILPPDFDITGIDDSKKLSARRREEQFARIMERCVVGVGMSDAAIIDEINILQATKRAAMLALAAVEQLLAGSDHPIRHVLLDALTLDGCKYPQTAIVKGDSLSASIAAASIVAKVTRDRLMKAEDAAHPEYGFARHKGYGTKEHYAAIDAHGPLPGHRRSFLRKRYGD